MSKKAPQPSAAIARSGRIKELTPDPGNANRGKPRGAELLERSLRTYGAGRSILVDKHGVVIAGNKTLEGAAAIGLEDTIVVPTDGNRLVVVQRTDLDLTDGVAAKELAIADNRAGELGLAWDASALESLQHEGVDLGEFFRDNELNEVLSGSEDDGVEGEPIDEMEIKPFEHHDYIMVVFRDTHDWSRACDLLGITREGVTIGGRRKIGIGRVIPAARLFAVLDKPRKA